MLKSWFFRGDYLVNKYMGYGTYQNNNILYKIETSYTDIKDYDSISDYLQFGIGAEYTQEINNFNLIYIAEYYKYKQFDDNKKSVNDLNIIFQNDLLLALKYNVPRKTNHLIKHSYFK